LDTKSQKRCKELVAGEPETAVASFDFTIAIAIAIV